MAMAMAINGKCQNNLINAKAWTAFARSLSVDPAAGVPVCCGTNSAASSTSAASSCRLRLGDGPAATPELDGELLGRQMPHQLLLRGQRRRRNSGEGAPVELVAFL